MPKKSPEFIAVKGGVYKLAFDPNIAHTGLIDTATTALKFVNGLDDEAMRSIQMDSTSHELLVLVEELASGIKNMHEHISRGGLLPRALEDVRPSRSSDEVVEYKGAKYAPVAVPNPFVMHKGALYKLVSAERDQAHIQEFLRKKKLDQALTDMLGEIRHVSPHRSKGYDPTKVRMIDDEEQQTYDKLQQEVTQTLSQQHEKDVDLAGGYVDPAELEEDIMFGEEETLPNVTEIPTMTTGPSSDADLHVRVSDTDFEFLSSIPGMKQNQNAFSFLQAVQRGVRKSRNEVWVSERKLLDTAKVLRDFSQDANAGEEERTHAQDMAARFEALAEPPVAKKKVPSYESTPRGEGNIRTFSYRGAMITRRRRR